MGVWNVIRSAGVSVIAIYVVSLTFLGSNRGGLCDLI